MSTATDTTPAAETARASLTQPRAVAHLGLTVPDLDDAMQRYTSVLRLRLMVWSETTRLLNAFRLDVDPALPISRVGVVEQQLISIARAMSRDARIIILDDLTASLVFRHGNTYSGHAPAFAVRLANVDVIEREELVDRVRAMEGLPADIVSPLRTDPVVVDVRAGVGLLGAVEIDPQARADDAALVGRIVTKARKNSVLTRAFRDVALQISAAFTVTREEPKSVTHAIAESLKAARHSGLVKSTVGGGQSA